MKIYMLIGLMGFGCSTGDISIGDIATGNVIASKDVVFDYDNFNQEADEIKMNVWKGRVPTKADRAQEVKGQTFGSEQIREILKGQAFGDGLKTVSLGTNYFGKKFDVKDFVKFLDDNPRVESARGELQLVYYYTLAIIKPARMLIYGCYRSKEKQFEKFKKGLSQVKFGDHNYNPSHACDTVPLKNGKAMWEDYSQFHFLIGVKKGIATELNTQLNWHLKYISGADWDNNNETTEKTSLYDPGHDALTGKMLLTQEN